MSQGTCLCGSIKWFISGLPQAAYHCHCSMCRKAHGAAFATYYLVAAEKFSWRSELDTLQAFQSKLGLMRSFCSECGSIVPNHSDTDEIIYVPAGSHDDGPDVDAHIFTASKAPWYNIKDSLPQHDAYTPNDNNKVYPDKVLTQPQPGIVRGSCLCDAIQFHVTEPFKVVHNCHCSRCRRARGAAFTTNGFTSIDGVDFIKGESKIKVYKIPQAKFFTHAFCECCGSGIPRKDPQRGIAVIPLGALDDDPGCGAVDHIFADDSVSWYSICDGLPVFSQMPE